MANIFSILQLVSAPLLIALVLLQRAQGDVGGTNTDGGTFLQSRRGFERFLFSLTVITAVIFAAASLLVVAMPA